MIDAGSVYSELILNGDKYFKTLEKAEKEMSDFSKKLQDAGKSIESTGKDLMLKVTTPIVGFGTAATTASIKFESAFAGVLKTVDGTTGQLAELEQGIIDMSKEIPASATAIAEVAESAGQLGIKTENILSFSRVMIDMGEATNLSADEAATSLARLANITGMSQQDFDRLGSAIVDLGNNLATTEAEIVAMGLRLAGAGSQIGLSEAQIMSFAGALSSVGIEAEAGGSAFSKVMIDMQLAVETNSERLKEFADVAGMSGEEFRKAFQEDAAGAIIAFIQGLGTAEERGLSAIKVLDDMGISEVRLRDALLRASGASDVFTESLEIGTNAWEENIALTNEAEQRYATSESQLLIFKNHIIDLARDFGNLLLPRLLEIVQTLQEWVIILSNLDDGTKQTIIQLAALAAAIGPVLFAGGKLISWVGNTSDKLIGLAKYIKDVGGATGLMGKAFGAITSPAGLMVIALAGMTAAVVYLWNTNEEFRKKVAIIWTRIKDIFDTALKFIQQVIEVFIDQVTKFWDIFGEDLMNLADSTWRFIVDIIDVALNIIGGLLDVFIGLITGDWEQMSEGLSKIWQGLWEGIKTIVEGAWGLLSGAFSILWSAISEWFISLKNDAINWGKDIVRGLWDGIKSMGSWITGKVKEFGSWVANGFKSILGIASPSKVFAEYGKFTVEGYVKGIEQNKYKAIKSVEDMGKMVVSEYDKLGNAVITALRRKYQEEERLQLDSLRRQTENIRRETDERLRQYDRELKAKLEVLDLETSEEERKLQEQIDAINNKTKEEEKQLREQEYQNRIAAKEKELLEAENAEERLKIQAELNQIKADRERELLLEHRQMQIAALQDEMAKIRQQAAEKRQELELEYEEKRKNEENKLNTVIVNLEDEMEATKEHYATLLEEERLQAQARTLILDENNQEMIALLESYNPHWQNAGQSFGESLLAGLNSTKQSIQDAVDEILSMVGQADRAAASVHNQNAVIIEAKRDWERAYKAGDKTEMEEANRRAEEARARGGTIGYDETLEEALRRIGRNAHGTNYFSGGLTWVGEQGPELIELPRGSKVYSNQKSMELVGKSGGDIYQEIHIHSPEPLSPSEVARKNLQASRQLAMEWGL